MAEMEGNLFFREKQVDKVPDLQSFRANFRALFGILYGFFESAQNECCGQTENHSYLLVFKASRTIPFI
jgi:hypothetical protein